MTSDNGLPHAGKLLVDSLLTHGVDTAFCVPGESYLAVLDALHDVLAARYRATAPAA